MLCHAVALCDQRAAQLGHQFLAGVLFRTERGRLESVEYAFRSGRVNHLMEQRSVERFPVPELFLFGYDNLVFRDRVVCFVLVHRFDGTNPKVVLYHRIDRPKTEMFAVFDPFPVLSFQLLP